MPRIPVRSEPYSSPPRRQRQFKAKRDQILRALSSASYINGSQFAILWVNARGETEQFASDIFQQKLASWFTPDVLADARQTVLQAPQQPKPSSEDLTTSERELSGELDFAEDQVDDQMAWKEHQEAMHSAMPTPLDGTFSFGRHESYGLIDRPALGTDPRRPSSVPPIPRAMHSISMPEVPTLKSLRERPEQMLIDLSKAPTSNATATPDDPEYRLLCIGDAEELATFLETRFRQLQQLVCKIVAKAWIKVLEPKKQTRFPYNKGDESKPAWWPSNVRHKEPDHLMKPERIQLLMTMLRFGKVPISRLERATAEIAALIPADKMIVLRELYHVAKEEERVKSGELNVDHCIYVTTLSGSNPPLELETAVSSNDALNDSGKHAQLHREDNALEATSGHYSTPLTSPYLETPSPAYPSMPGHPSQQSQQHLLQHQHQHPHHQQVPQQHQQQSENHFYYSRPPLQSRSSRSDYESSYVPPRCADDTQHASYNWPQATTAQHHINWQQPQTTTSGSFYLPLDHTQQIGMHDDKEKDLSHVRGSYLQRPSRQSMQTHSHLTNFQPYINSERHAGVHMGQSSASSSSNVSAQHGSHGQHDMTSYA